MDIKDFFEAHSEVAVAFSGGVDSAVLLLLAKKYAKRVKAYFVKSQFQPEFEYEDALKIADLLGVEMDVISVDVLADNDVAKNPENRCYFCKRRVFETILRAAGRDGLETVLDGTNASDDISDRPGFKALLELGVLSPLRECGYTKKEIRKMAEKSNLPVASKPSYACLATRIPTGTKITSQLLEKTEKAENLLRKAGFRSFRVRYLNGAAKLELAAEEFELLYKNRKEIEKLLSELYTGVYLDLRERADE